MEASTPFAERQEHAAGACTAAGAPPAADPALRQAIEHAVLQAMINPGDRGRFADP